MHSLQCNKEIGWDNRLSEDLLREWNNIAKQLNSSPTISVNRFVGRRDDMYNLIAYTDSSRSIYSCVVFLYDLRTKKKNFVMAKNKFVNKQLESKSIPSLEFQEVSLGTEVFRDIRRELSGSNCVEHINILVVGMDLYTDSLVCLHWLSAHVTKFDKLRNLSIFVKNRLDSIFRMCEEFPIKFKFCAGSKNPADAITRPLSYKQLMNSNFFSGTVADADIDVFASDMMEVTIPNTLLREEGISSSLESSNVHVATESVVREDINHLVSMDSFSGFKSIVSVHRYVIRFINNLKIAVKMRDPSKYSHFNCLTDEETLSEAYNFVIYRDQQIHFPEAFKYFAGSSNAVKEIPNIISQLNIYPDHNGILRVRSKTARWKDRDKFMFSPILLSKDSVLTKKLILEMHKMTNHAGIYSLLTEFRKTFWVSHFFSTVKKILKEYINCRRFHRHAVKLNQSPCRDFRLKPPNIPFRSIFLDYLGPYYIKYQGVKTKIWLLCITCLWSRAINLKLCFDMTVPTFLRALQLHIWEYGTPQLCFSDMGSQIVAGTNLISDFLSDPDTVQYLQEHGMRAVEFEQYYKGCN
ncbi:uncharacterized protein [Palaemon carinicauda]